MHSRVAASCVSGPLWWAEALVGAVHGWRWPRCQRVTEAAELGGIMHRLPCHLNRVCSPSVSASVNGRRIRPVLCELLMFAPIAKP